MNRYNSCPGTGSHISVVLSFAGDLLFNTTFLVIGIGFLVIGCQLSVVGLMCERSEYAGFQEVTGLGKVS